MRTERILPISSTAGPPRPNRPLIGYAKDLVMTPSSRGLRSSTRSRIRTNDSRPHARASLSKFMRSKEASMRSGQGSKVVIGALTAAAMLAGSAARAQTHVKVMVFPGLSNLSIYAAERNNLFAKHGLVVELLYTPNSDVLRNGLAKSEHQIAHAAVDNAVAMAELAGADVAIVTGGDDGFNRIFVQPEINAYAALRG